MDRQAIWFGSCGKLSVFVIVVFCAVVLVFGNCFVEEQVRFTFFICGCQLNIQHAKLGNVPSDTKRGIINLPLQGVH